MWAAEAQAPRTGIAMLRIDVRLNLFWNLLKRCYELSPKKTPRKSLRCQDHQCLQLESPAWLYMRNVITGAGYRRLFACHIWQQPTPMTSPKTRTTDEALIGMPSTSLKGRTQSAEGLKSREVPERWQIAAQAPWSDGPFLVPNAAAMHLALVSPADH